MYCVCKKWNDKYVSRSGYVTNCIYWFWNIHQFTLDRGFQNWITDYGKRKCIWSYWCGEIVLLLLVVALENMNQLAAASAILGVMAAYIVVGIWWVSRKL